MSEREEIRKLLDSLPLPQRLRIEREAAKYRAKKPLDMEDLWEKFKKLWAEEAPVRELEETKRRETLREYDDSDN